MLVEAAVKLGKWPREDIVVEISLGAFGEHDDDHRRKRIDIYFIDRESRCVVAVELKCSSDLPRAIADANAKYGPFLACGAPIDAIRPAGGEPLPNVEGYAWERNLHIFALGTWLAVPGESTATMDRLRIPLHEQDRVLCRAAKAVLKYNARIANRHLPAGCCA